MGLFNFSTIALLTGAYLSNPDEDSFHRYIQKQMKKEGSHWIERKIASLISSTSCRREVNELHNVLL